MLLTKRSGEQEQFDINKINKSLAVVTQANVLQNVIRKLDRINNTEQIAKIIENELMDSGLYDAARSFIQYRQNKTGVNINQIRRIEKWLSDYIIQSKYAKFEGESWEQIVERSGLVGKDSIKVLQKLVLPSMRSLQFGGEAIRAKNERMFNCSYTPIDRISAFGQILRLLLCGCGVGVSVERQYTDCLPVIKKNNKVIHHRVKDSIEGWCEALDLMMTVPEYVEYDYSEIRAEGMPLITSGGIAPGHIGLKESLEDIRAVLPNGRQLRPFEVWKIVCLASRAVLSGGIRRSSIICLFDKYDYEILGAKVNNKMESWMHLSNNTIALREPDAQCVERALETALLYGEPGIARLEQDCGINPCGEILIGPIRQDIGFCNLCEIRVDDNPDYAELLERANVAYDIGLKQSEYATTKWSKENRLLGISLNGCAGYDNFDNIEKVRKHLEKRGARDGVKRITCIKPSGTSSLVLGIHGSGIHFPHARYYYRRIVDFGILPMYCPGRTLDDVGLAEQLYVLENYYKNWIGESGHSISVTLTVRDGEIANYKNKIVDLLNTGKVRALSFAPYNIEKLYANAPRERTCGVDRNWHKLVNGFVEPSLIGIRREKGNACESGICSLDSEKRASL